MILFDFLLILLTVIVGVRSTGLIVFFRSILLVFAAFFALIWIFRRSVVVLLRRARLSLLLFVLLHARPFFVLLRSLILLVIFIVFVVPHAFVDDVAVVTIFTHFLLHVLLGIVFVFVVTARVDVFHDTLEVILHLYPAVLLFFAAALVFMLFLFLLEILHA